MVKQRLNVGIYEPTMRTIYSMTAAIRKRWSAREREKRRVGPGRQEWELPIVEVPAEEAAKLNVNGGDS